ncbi:MAG: hypothetical protein KKG99_01130 [Bacteroidetes bacterium]|nr:hypothetical protein [Bacteroidota bacterium]
MEILLSDDEGFDLFDPESYTYYYPDSIKIFYIINDLEVEMNNPLLTPPRNFYVNYANGRYRLQLFPNHDDSIEFPVTLIKLNKTITDTVRCGYERNPGSITCTKVWYNGDIVWQKNAPDQARSFEIIRYKKKK